MGFPDGASGKEPTCQHRRLKGFRFDPWVGTIPWRRAWHSTPVFLLGGSHGQRSLVGYTLWDCKESDTTEREHSTLPLTPATRMDSAQALLHHIPSF